MPGAGGPSGPPLGGLRPRPGPSDTPDGLSDSTRRRIGRGFLWGLVATAAMSAVTYAGLRTGLLGLPEPVAVALAEEIVGDLVGSLGILVVAGSAHLLYGGFWGSVLSVARKRVRLPHGLVLGVALWIVMSLLLAPMVGWGLFLAEVGYGAAVAALVPHLVYGATLGALFERGPGPADRSSVTLGVRGTGGS